MPFLSFLHFRKTPEEPLRLTILKARVNDNHRLQEEWIRGYEEDHEHHHNCVNLANRVGIPRNEASWFNNLARVNTEAMARDRYAFGLLRSEYKMLRREVSCALSIGPF